MKIWKKKKSNDEGASITSDDEGASITSDVTTTSTSTTTFTKTKGKTMIGRPPYDPIAPKRLPSAWMVFFNEKKDILAQKQPDKSLGKFRYTYTYIYVYYILC
jgi:hypothetical protein